MLPCWRKYDDDIFVSEPKVANDSPLPFPAPIVWSAGEAGVLWVVNERRELPQKVIKIGVPPECKLPYKLEEPLLDHAPSRQVPDRSAAALLHPATPESEAKLAMSRREPMQFGQVDLAEGYRHLRRTQLVMPMHRPERRGCAQHPLRQNRSRVYGASVKWIRIGGAVRATRSGMALIHHLRPQGPSEVGVHGTASWHQRRPMGPVSIGPSALAAKD